MKNLINAAKYSLYILLCIVFISCKERKPVKTATQTFNELKSPVTLFAKSESNLCSGCWGVDLMDGNGVLHSFGNLTNIGNGVGESYNVGDTIK